MLDVLKRSLNHGAEIPVYAPSPQVIHEKGFNKLRKVLYGRTSYYYEDIEAHPLCLAVKHGHLDIMEFLLARGCDINMINPEEHSLLCLAVIHGHVHVVKSLLGLGATQSKKGSWTRNSPIQIAAHKGDSELVKMLLYDSLDSNRPDVQHSQEALECALYEGHNHIIRILLDTDLDPNFCFRGTEDRWVNNPLFWAIEKDDYDLVKLLLSKGAKLQYGNHAQDIALLRAVKGNQENIVRLLVCGTERQWRTQALSQSMDYRDGRIAQILLENGTLPDFEESDDALPLPVRPSNVREIPLYLRRILPPQRIPPLIRAVSLGHAKLVRLLVIYGANVNVGYEGRLQPRSFWSWGGPLALAMKLGHQHIVKCLRNHGAKEDIGEAPILAKLRALELDRARGRSVESI